MEEWVVWEEVPIERCLKATGKRPLGGRWVDVNKGDRTHPDIRSRWVAKDIAYYKTDAFFAATPPLEALRLIMSEASSQSPRVGKELNLMLLDAKRPTSMQKRAGRSTWIFPPSARARATAAVFCVVSTEPETPHGCGRTTRQQRW